LRPLLEAIGVTLGIYESGGALARQVNGGTPQEAIHRTSLD
tara:strand:- start:58 stop:180 length:123 start_codon:yes stop_codon:yes gene_type:complete